MDHIWIFETYEVDGINSISFHKTPQGAYKELKEYLMNIYNEWRSDWYLHGRK